MCLIFIYVYYKYECKEVEEFWWKVKGDESIVGVIVNIFIFIGVFVDVDLVVVLFMIVFDFRILGGV